MVTVNRERKFSGNRLNRQILKGVTFWNHRRNARFRILGLQGAECAVTVTDALSYAERQLEIELNSTDDNPCLLPKRIADAEAPILNRFPVRLRWKIYPQAWLICRK